jgi:hypothetical protein
VRKANKATNDKQAKKRKIIWLWVKKRHCHQR